MNTLIPTSLFGSILGMIVGAIWSLGLDCGMIPSLKIGAIAGVTVGLIIGLMGGAASSRGRINKNESAFASGSLMILIGMGTGAIGLLVWLVRAIF